MLHEDTPGKLKQIVQDWTPCDTFFAYRTAIVWNALNELTVCSLTLAQFKERLGWLFVTSRMLCFSQVYSCLITARHWTVLICFRGTMLAPLRPLVSFFKPCALHFCVLVLLVCMLEIKSIQFNSTIYSEVGCMVSTLVAWSPIIDLCDYSSSSCGLE